MKNIVKIGVLCFAVVLVCSNIVFAKDRVISKVEIDGIDEPFESSSTLDLTGTVDRDVDYRISEISWKIDKSTGKTLYEVFITVKPNKGYIFSGDVEAYINGNPATSTQIVYDDEFVLSYLFTEKKNDSISYTTLKHRILTYYDEEKGRIEPDNIRVPDGTKQTFQIIPKEGYRVKDVRIDGSSVGPVTEYTLRKIKEGHTIRAYFEKIETEESISENIEIKPLLQFLLDIIYRFKL